MLEDAFTTVKSDSSGADQMTYRDLPCGCMMQWDEDETTVVFCGRHTLDYMYWDGSDRDFVKMIATPSSRRPIAEMH
jgi:hypothetical protein